MKRVVELGSRRCVVILSSSVFRELDQSMFPASLAPRTALDRNNDDGINNRFGLFGGADSLFVIDPADGIASVSDQDDHLASLSMIQRSRSQINGVEKSSRGSHSNVIDAFVDALNLGGVTMRRFNDHLAEG